MEDQSPALRPFGVSAAVTEVRKARLNSKVQAGRVSFINQR
jgi:hypothetical protein